MGEMSLNIFQNTIYLWCGRIIGSINKKAG